MSAGVLLTGAAGRVATVLRPMLRRHRRLRLTDLRPPDPPPAPRETFVQGDLADPAFAAECVRGIDTVIHLAGHPRDTDWATLLSANVATTAHLLDAARQHAVTTFLHASSIHVLGGHNDPADWPVPDSAPARPCCRYGASKLAAEDLLRWYADRSPRCHVACLRLPLVTYPPRTELEISSWLADEDLVRLVEAALTAPVGFTVHVGTSVCPRPRFDIAAIETDLGFRPRIRADEVPRADRPPAYAPECNLWRLPAVAADGSSTVRRTS